MSKLFIKILLLAGTIVVSSVNLYAQIKQNKPLDILSGLNNGTIRAKVEPALPSNQFAKIFDGNPYIEAVALNTDTLSITLSLDKAVKIGKSKLFGWSDGNYTLDVAGSEEDLKNRSGTYQVLAKDKPYAFFKWDSVSFAATEVRALRLKSRTQIGKVIIGEWVIEEEHTITSLSIQPQPLLLVPSASLQLAVKMKDEGGNLYPYTLPEAVKWSSSNPAVAAIDDTGLLRGIAVGTSEITAATSVLTGTATARVEPDFVPPKAPQRTVKVALVLQNPVIDSTGMRKIHQVRGWADPVALSNQLIQEFLEASDGVVKFQIVETYDDAKIFSRMDGQFMTVDTLIYYFSDLSRLYGRTTPGTLQYLSEVQGRVKFDYNAMIDYYDFDTKRNNGVIDEVWVYAYPFAAMYESQLVGPNAFWWNSPPLAHPGLEKLLSVMGLNYERGIPEAMESFGHRMESALWKAFGRWNVHAEPRNHWEIFTTIDKDRPGEAQVGNIHFPPNGQSDYDWGNRRTVPSYADNWRRYPYLFNIKRSFNCNEWGCNNIGYLRWWYRHLPHADGVTQGILNNWWHYWYDYEGAVELAKELSSDVKQKEPDLAPGAYYLEQNYPNPFNPFTTIPFSLAKPSHVTLIIYDALGREVQRILDEWRTSGQHEIAFDGQHLTTGVYFYKLSAGEFQQTRRFLLLK